MPGLHKRTALAEWRHQVREMRRRTQALSRDRPHSLRLRSLRESHLPAQMACVCAEHYSTQDVVLRDVLDGLYGVRYYLEADSAGDSRHLQTGLPHDTPPSSIDRQ